MKNTQCGFHPKGDIDYALAGAGALCSIAHTMHRSILLGISLMVLVGTIGLAWNHRYERVSQEMEYSLAELKMEGGGNGDLQGVERISAVDGNMQLRLTREQGADPVFARLFMPLKGEFEAVHVRFRISARGLKPGKHVWNDGRLNIAWLLPSTREVNHAGSVRHDDSKANLSVVSHAPVQGAIAQIECAHLGQSGVYEVAEVVVTPVRSRWWWSSVAWVLGVASVLWLVVTIRCLTGVRWWRVVAVTALCFIVLYELVIPGPWVLRQPLMVQQFELGSIGDSVACPASVNVPTEMGHEQKPLLDAGGNALPKTIGEMVTAKGGAETNLKSESAQTNKPPQVKMKSNLILQLKYLLEPLSLVAHAVFSAGLGLVLTCLVRWWPALCIGLALSLSTELAQLAFWGGIDLDDLSDIAMNALGLGVGVTFTHGLGILIAKFRSKGSLSMA